jgi:cyanate permease
VVKQEGWSNTLGWWAVPMIVTAVFSVWAFYQFPCE